MAARVSVDPDYFLPKSDGAVTSLSYFRRPEEESDNGHVRLLLLSGTEKGSLYTWDLRTRRPTSQTVAHRGESVTSLTVVADDEIVSQGRDGFVHRWKADAGNTWTKLGSVLSFLFRSPRLCNVAGDLCSASFF